jgi:hypothetical protein
MLAQLVTHFKRAESSRATNESSRASYRATSFLSSPKRECAVKVFLRHLLVCSVVLLLPSVFFRFLSVRVSP